MKIVLLGNKFSPQKLQKDNQQDGFLPIDFKENVCEEILLFNFSKF